MIWHVRNDVRVSVPNAAYSTNVLTSPGGRETKRVNSAYLHIHASATEKSLAMCTGPGSIYKHPPSS